MLSGWRLAIVADGVRVLACCRAVRFEDEAICVVLRLVTSWSSLLVFVGVMAVVFYSPL